MRDSRQSDADLAAPLAGEVERLRARVDELASQNEREIEARERVEQKLCESEQLFNDFARHSDVLHGVISPELDRFLYVSPAWEHMVGLKPADVYANPLVLFDVIASEDRAAIASFLAQPVGGDGEIEIRVVAKEGAIRRLGVRVSVVRDAAQRPLRVLFSAEDITERKQAEAAMHASREQYGVLAELTSDFNFSARISPRVSAGVEWVSPSFERITSYALSEVARNRWPEWVDPEDRKRLRVWGAELRPGCAPRAIEYRITRRDGESRWLRTRVQLGAPGPDGELHALGSTTDITESKRLAEERQRYAARLEIEVADRTRQLERANKSLRELQDRLIRTERMRTAEDLAASIAHSINNPLAALIGSVQMMIENDPSPAPLLRRSLELCHRIRIVVERTLQLFRKGTLDLGLVDPAEILDEVHRELDERAQRSAVKLKTGVGPELPGIEADRALLVAALVSVAENALDAMPHGGRLELSVSRILELDTVRFRIADTGHGIPEAIQERVLEPFFTTKGGGTGLGLAIAQGVVQGHDGRMHIRPRGGEGTVVTIEIPLKHGRHGRSANDPV